MIPKLLNRFFVGCENDNIPKSVKKTPMCQLELQFCHKRGGKNENFIEHFGAFKTSSLLMHGNGVEKINEFTTT
jgi:hypothetical protein